jgi:hypothetical protein
VSRGRIPRLAATHSLLAALLVLCAPALWAAQSGPLLASPGALPPVKVRDLYYGDVLFYFYQDDYFAALTRLTAAQANSRLTHHGDDAQLLLGGLYLSVGQHREAGQIFAEVLQRPGVPAGVRDRARFFLGKVWYQRGYFEKASDALAAAGKAGLTPAMEAERRMLLAQALMAQHRYDDAVVVLDGWKGPPVWQAYAQFNLGVALVRSGRLDLGARALDTVGTLERTNPELDALRDKANLALGYAFLQANRPLEAKPVLERVRLDGPLSTRALLGVGWASSGAEQNRDALIPWLELHGRNMLDAAVQESYLAVPYAYAKLGANSQAADYYELAIREFATETGRLDESIAAIRRGGLLDVIVKNESKGQMGWFWQLSSLPDAPESRYLYHLLAQNEFQEGLKNYRMMQFMGKNLDTWTGSIDAFDDMLNTRRERYETRLPPVLAKLEGTDVQDLQRRRTEYESRLASAESTGDVAALGTPRERELWSQVGQLEGGLAVAGDDAALDDAREKLRLIRGVLYWQMNDGFKARAWSEKKALRGLAQSLRETEKRWSLVQEAKQTVPDRNGEFGDRVAALRPRLQSAQDRLVALERAQTDYLAAVAVRELEAQKDRISTYMLQARYSLATIYDRAAAIEEHRSARGRGEAAPPTDVSPELQQ